MIGSIGTVDSSDTETSVDTDQVISREIFPFSAIHNDADYAGSNMNVLIAQD